MEKVKIKHKTLKIKIYPTNKQKKVLNEWSNTFRYIANVTIEKREKNKEKNNFFDFAEILQPRLQVYYNNGKSFDS